MGEALMFRAGSSGGGGYELKTEIITSNTIFKVPKAKNNKFDVLLFGGGGSGSFIYDPDHYKYEYCGGGGGWMNKATLELNEGDEIYVTIGEGGAASSNKGASGSGNNTYTNSSNGGTSSFGNYLSANGGSNTIGASGGGYFMFQSTYTYSGPLNINRSIGHQFGGGSLYFSQQYSSVNYLDSARGGTWGGGGACYVINNNALLGNNYAKGGNNGGNGHRSGNAGYSRFNINAENGINTMANTELEANYKGHGICGNNCGGGGGYGGNGGNNYGGGGGWAAKGGDNYGGGGGYGIGGYGGSGSAINIKQANRIQVGGGGGYGHGGGIEGPAGYGAGGCGGSNQTYMKGGNGICIIQYYGR